jgi:hypothetical protein
VLELATSKTRAEGAPEQVIGFELLERNLSGPLSRVRVPLSAVRCGPRSAVRCPLSAVRARLSPKAADGIPNLINPAAAKPIGERKAGPVLATPRSCPRGRAGMQGALA